MLSCEKSRGFTLWVWVQNTNQIKFSRKNQGNCSTP